MKLKTLAKNTPAVAMVFRTVGSPLSSQWVNGMSQPPKNSVTISAEAVTMFEYSAMMNIENFIELYSAWYPATSSGSASGRSNGTRFVSATAATKNTKKASDNGKMFQCTIDSCCPATTWLSATFPATSRTATVLMPM